MFQNKLGYSIKKRKKKRTNVPLKIKRDLAAQVSSQNLQVSKRGI
jgi:hypothetical protein